MPTLMELLAKASAPPPPPAKPPQLPEPFQSIAHGIEAGVRTLQPAVEMTAQVMYALQAPVRGLVRVTEALQEEPWKSLIEGIAEIVRNWPTDPYGRPLELEEWHYGFAAWEAVGTAREAPKTSERDKALDAFLLLPSRWESRYHKLGLGLELDPKLEAHKRVEKLHLWRIALLELVTEQLAKEASEKGSWIFDSEQCRDRLRKEMLAKHGRVKDLWEDRKIEDEVWTAANLHKIRNKKTKHLPQLCEFDPERNAVFEEDPAETVSLTNADVMEGLMEFYEKERKQFSLQKLGDFLPEQELQVLLLRVKHPTWTYQQIADELGLSKSTVGTYAERTRDRGEKTPEIKELVEGLM